MGTNLYQHRTPAQSSLTQNLAMFPFKRRISFQIFAYTVTKVMIQLQVCY